MHMQLYLHPAFVKRQKPIPCVSSQYFFHQEQEIFGRVLDFVLYGREKREKRRKIGKLILEYEYILYADSYIFVLIMENNLSKTSFEDEK